MMIKALMVPFERKPYPPPAPFQNKKTFFFLQNHLPDYLETLNHI